MFVEDSLYVKDILRCSLGCMVEWFDLSIYFYLTPVFIKIFFLGGDAHFALTIVFLLPVISAVLRMVGGVFFGHIGDKWGRKKVLILSMFGVTVSCLFIAVLPTYHNIGSVAIILFALIRSFQGFFYSGGFSGAIVMLFEQADKKHIGLITSLSLFSSGVGAILAGILLSLLSGFLSSQALYAWGWRIPYVVALFVSGVALWQQCRIKETDSFEKIRKNKMQVESPLKHVFSFYKSSIFKMAYLNVYVGLLYSIIGSFLPVLLSRFIGFSDHRTLVLSTYSLLVFNFMSPLFGWLSDKVGPGRVMMAAVFLSVVFIYPGLQLIQAHEWWAVVSGISILSLITSSFNTSFLYIVGLEFPVAVKSTGVNISYNLGVVVGSVFPLLFIKLIQATNMVSSICFIVIPAALMCLLLINKERDYQPLLIK